MMIRKYSNMLIMIFQNKISSANNQWEYVLETLIETSPPDSSQ